MKIIINIVERLKNILSFFYPIVVEIRTGEVTDYLEVVKSNGKYLLNSRNANYSFGGLHKVFDIFFRHIDLKQFDFKNVLVLGMGAGSIISLLKQEYSVRCSITAIEKDGEVIELSKNYFGIEKYENLIIVKKDALDYVATSTNTYDLIISDLFVDWDVPQAFASKEYLTNLKRISSPGALVVYNKMTELKTHKKELNYLFDNFKKVFPHFEIKSIYVNSSENSILYNNTFSKSKVETYSIKHPQAV